MTTWRGSMRRAVGLEHVTDRTRQISDGRTAAIVQLKYKEIETNDEK